MESNSNIKKPEYRILTDQQGNVGIVKVFYDERGFVDVYSNFITPHGFSERELSEDLENAARALDRPRLTMADLSTAKSIVIDRTKKKPSFFTSIKKKFMEAFGFESYVKITDKKVTTEWKLPWKINWYNIRSYFKHKVKLKNTDYRRYSFIMRHPPDMKIVRDKTGIPVDLGIYVKKSAIKAALENPVKHLGASSRKIGEVLRKQ